MEPQPNRTHSSVPPSRRRDKPQLSCNLCKRRKLKCDRNQPCGTCTRRGLSLSCTYVAFNPAASKSQHASQEAPVTNSDPPTNVSDRIGQLEQLVTSLASGNTPKSTEQSTTEPQNRRRDVKISFGSQQETDPNLSCRDPPPLSESFGHISLQSSETSYADNTHWTSVLDGIAELKDSFQGNSKQSGTSEVPGAISSPEEPDILFGHYKPANKEQILAAIPSRPIVDRLLAEYFLNKNLAPMIVHSPTFLREYGRFWLQQQETSIMWIGQLFAVMCLGALYSQESVPLISDPKTLVAGYREKIIQCLVLGKYTKCAPYTIETLLLYLHVEYDRSENKQTDVWILIGVIVRLALRMGYHRDASHFPNISPFQGEMRRRAWAYITGFDALASAQVSLPRMVRESHCDTAEPRNLLDEDLYEEMLELPPAQPERVHTTVQFVVAKNKLGAIYGTISDEITAIQPIPYDEIMRLDKMLGDTYAALPQGLQMRPVTESTSDTPHVILNRIFLALQFHKTRCILHYRYMIPSRTDSQYIYSRSACISSSLEILEFQAILDEETKVGGRIYQYRWKISTLIKSSFFLATSLLCREVTRASSAEGSTDLVEAGIETGLRVRILPALHKSYQIWLKDRESSQEARKATEVLRLVLGNVQETANRPTVNLESPMDTTTNPEAHITDAGIGTKDSSLWLAGAPTLEQIEENNATMSLDLGPPISIHALLRNNIDFSDTPAEPVDLNQTLDEMLGTVSYSYPPGPFGFPMS